MTIKSKLIAVALIPVFLAIVAAVAVYWTNEEAARARARNSAIDNITRNVFELNLATDQYLRRPEIRPRMQFESVRKSLKEKVEAGIWTGREEGLVDRLRESQEAMGSLFSSLVSLAKGEDGREDKDTIELRERITGQLLANSRDIVTDALTLSAISAARMDSVRNRGLYWIFLAILLSLAMVLTLSSLTIRSVLAPINRLREAAKAVTRGDLGHQVEIESSDEIGQLGQAFNQMTAQLEQFYVSLKVLEKEIIERKRAEEALREARDFLELRVQERTAELSTAYETLQCEIEERKKAEEQLRQSQKMEAMGTLAGGIAHDFNNILAAIIGFTEMAVDDVEDRPEVGSSLQNVLKSAMRARDLVKQILTFSRKSGHERAPLSLTPLIKETVQLLRASIPATIEIKMTATASSDAILASPTEVQQILMNLATNASLAMQDSGGTLEIGLEDIRFAPDSPVFDPDMVPGEYLQLTVKDTGIGMSPEVMNRVFEPFFTTREVGEGTGMGLAMVYGIVKDLHGTITVESLPGKGSTFRVFFPKIKASVENEHLPLGRAPGGTESILFVDDEESLVAWGEATLKRLGYTVFAVTDSTEALRTFTTDPTRFDLVITDQTMRGMTGAQLAKAFLQVRPDIPIIVCTGHSETISAETAKEMGFKEYLMKPLAKQELARAIRHVLDTKEE
ncbi:MAG TPA: ATP-binding protein [Syntrophorhabdaceae bacterium]|jgi:signal transduction histidine kinase/ActR/RegA family two-component response regulator/HAMP domain-containing protein